MKKDLVDFSVAEGLQELGFKEPCLFYFTYSGYPKEFQENGFWFFSTGVGGRLILRPTQSEAARFIRDNFNISIEPCFIKGNWDCEVWNMTTDMTVEYMQVFDSHEAAYEHGLQRALNYIKYGK